VNIATSPRVEKSLEKLCNVVSEYTILGMIIKSYKNSILYKLEVVVGKISHENNIQMLVRFQIK
jgi:hypothetical protein